MNTRSAKWMVRCVVFLLATGLLSLLPFAQETIPTAFAGGVVGTGAPGTCTEAAFTAALAGGGLVTFNCGGGAVTIVLTSKKTLSLDTTINGGGLVTLSGNDLITPLQISSGKTVTITGVTISHGHAAADAGGIMVYGNLVLQDSRMESNQGGYGGAIYGNGSATISNTVFTSNIASVSGGAIYLDGAAAKSTITGSQFTSNQAVYNGGAVAADSGTRVEITNSRFSDNSVTDASSRGGGIYQSTGSVSISGSTLQNNTAGDGGGIYTTGAMTVTGSTITGNHITRLGGGGIFGCGTLIVSNTTFSDNNISGVANSQGGSLYCSSSYSAVLMNNTFANDSAQYGGSIYTWSPITITNSTIVSNTTGNASSGAIHRGGGTVTLKNSIVGYSSGRNCYGTMTDGGGNLQFGGSTANSCGAGITTADPKVGSLANNGGSTNTMALVSGSPAINTAIAANCPDTDQRGFARRKSNGFCDIGAFEAQPATIIATGGHPQNTNVSSAYSASLQVRVADGNNNSLGGIAVTFTAPSSGASASLTTPAVTNASGSTSVNATANAVPGTFSVTAGVPGVATPAMFSLTNNQLYWFLYLPLLVR